VGGIRDKKRIFLCEGIEYKGLPERVWGNGESIPFIHSKEGEEKAVERLRKVVFTYANAERSHWGRKGTSSRILLSRNERNHRRSRRETLHLNQQEGRESKLDPSSKGPLTSF